MSSKTTNESLLEAAPNAMGVDQAGVIRFVNHQTELLFGYDRGDLQGQPIERLARESFRKVHPAHRAGYFSDPKTQAMEAGPELTGLKAARQLKELAPQTKTILFTAHAELGAKTNDKPAVDAFLLKIDSAGLLPLAQELTDMLSPI